MACGAAGVVAGGVACGFACGFDVICSSSLDVPFFWTLEFPHIVDKLGFPHLVDLNVPPFWTLKFPLA